MASGDDAIRSLIASAIGPARLLLHSLDRKLLLQLAQLVILLPTRWGRAAAGGGGELACAEGLTPLGARILDPPRSYVTLPFIAFRNLTKSIKTALAAENTQPFQTLSSKTTYTSARKFA